MLLKLTKKMSYKPLINPQKILNKYTGWISGSSKAYVDTPSHLSLEIPINSSAINAQQNQKKHIGMAKGSEKAYV